MGKAENKNNDPERSSEPLLHVFGVEDKALMYKRSLSVYNHGLCPTSLLYASVSEAVISILRKDPLWDSSLGLAVYSGRDSIRPQSPGQARFLSRI